MKEEQDMKHHKTQPLSVAKLKFLASKNLNVMMIGKLGIGKTSTVLKAWEELGLKYKVYSGATVDPFIEFIGLPLKKEDEHTKENVIDFARPKDLDEVEAIFIDEFNRGHKQTKNAVMELIQFKSINGRKLKNLKIVWAACNPMNEEDGSHIYDVDKIDSAQLDRFHVHIHIPYAPNKEYFVSKYGGDVADQILGWWKAQTEDVKNSISPRRLEYAIDAHMNDCDIQDFITHEGATTSKLIELIGSMPKIKKLHDIYLKNDNEECAKFLIVEGNYDQVIDKILNDKNSDVLQFCIPNFPEEKLSKLISEDNWRVVTYALQKAATDKKLYNIFKDIVKAGANKKLIIRIKSKFDSIENEEKTNYILKLNNKSEKFALLNNGVESSSTYSKFIFDAVNEGFKTSVERSKIYSHLEKEMPESMDEADAEWTLNVINSIISKTQKPSLEKNCSNLMAMINCAVSNLKAKEKDFSKYQYVFEYIKTNNGFICSDKIEVEEGSTVISSH